MTSVDLHCILSKSAKKFLVPVANYLFQFGYCACTICIILYQPYCIVWTNNGGNWKTILQFKAESFRLWKTILQFWLNEKLSRLSQYYSVIYKILNIPKTDWKTILQVPPSKIPKSWKTTRAIGKELVQFYTFS